MKHTRGWFAATALLCALAAHSRADGEPPKDLAALEEQFEKSETPRNENYVAMRPEFEAFAKAHAGTKEGLAAKLWLLQNTWWLKDDKGSMEDAAAKLADEIFAEYPKSEDLAKIADWSYVFRKDKHAEYLAKLMSAKFPPAVRAAAGLANAIGVKRGANPADADALFAALAKDYGKLARGYTTYAAVADAYLHPLAPADIAIGKIAPDIVGSSPDGRAMKLSDFKGRVVVIDFFGDW